MRATFITYKNLEICNFQLLVIYSCFLNKGYYLVLFRKDIV